MFRKRSVSLDPSVDPTSIGNLIVKEGLLTKVQLEEMVKEFKQLAGVMLGQFLVEHGILTVERLQIVLLKQQAARNGGVEHTQVMEAFRLAASVQDRVDSQVDRLLAVTSVVVAKARLK
jgi:hypothetical protein